MTLGVSKIDSAGCDISGSLLTAGSSQHQTESTEAPGLCPKQLTVPRTGKLLLWLQWMVKKDHQGKWLSFHIRIAGFREDMSGASKGEDRWMCLRVRKTLPSSLANGVHGFPSVCVFSKT